MKSKEKAAERFNEPYRCLFGFYIIYSSKLFDSAAVPSPDDEPELELLEELPDEFSPEELPDELSLEEQNKIT